MFWDTMAPNGTARITSILADTVSAILGRPTT